MGLGDDGKPEKIRDRVIEVGQAALVAGVEGDGVAVDHFRLGAEEAGALRPARLLAREQLHRELDVLGRELGAVRERHALPEEEDPPFAVVRQRPALGEPGLGLQGLRVIVDEIVVDDVEVGLARGRAEERVERFVEQRGVGDGEGAIRLGRLHAGGGDGHEDDHEQRGDHPTDGVRHGHVLCPFGSVEPVEPGAVVPQDLPLARL